MAQTAAVVRQTLAADSTPVGFTKTGFGSPDAGIVISCGANAGANPWGQAELNVGFWDGTNQRAMGFTLNGAGTNMRGGRASSDGHVVLCDQSYLDDTYTSYVASPATDGIELAQDVNSGTTQRYCTALLLKGIEAKAITLTPSSSQDGTVTSESLGFAPKLILFATINAATADSIVASSADSAKLSFGFAEIGGAHRMIAFDYRTNTGTANNALLYSETRAVGWVSALSNAISWTGEVTNWGSDDFTLTTRDGATGGAVVFALALGGADLSYDFGTLTTRTSVGDDVISTDIALDTLLLALSTAIGTTLHNDGNANGLTIGLADDNGQFAHSAAAEDNATNSSIHSAAQAAAAIDLDTRSAGSVVNMCDATVALNSGDFTPSYSLANATARKGWWLGFGAAGSSEHATSGALVGPGATLAGSAAHVGVHATSGALVGAGAALSGTATATHFVTHETSGALVGSGAAITGSAELTQPGQYTATGDLVGPGSALAGSAARTRAHATSGALVGQGAGMAGNALRIPAPVTHETSGALTGSGASIAGSAFRYVPGSGSSRRRRGAGAPFVGGPARIF